jgi:CMP-N,N'-diacetyllegionaminic acid synthase
LGISRTRSIGSRTAKGDELSAESLRVLGVVPARGGSKGLPGKNTTLIGGKPLLLWSIEHGLDSRTIDRVVCTTDEESIGEIARAGGAEVPFLRPAELATDDANDVGFTLHAIEWYRDHEDWSPDIVVILRPTCPGRRVSDIDAFVELLSSRPDAHSCISVVEPEKTPYKMVRPTEDGLLVPLLTCDSFDQLNAPRQSLPMVYAQTGALHAIWSDIVVRDHTVMGSRILPYVMSGREASIDIDSIEDLRRAETLFQGNEPE